VVKCSGDVTRLQALVDKKKIVISEDVIHEILRLDNAEGMEIADDVAQPTLPLPPSPVIPSSPPHQSPRPSPPQVAEGSSILVQRVLDKCSVVIREILQLDDAEGVVCLLNEEIFACLAQMEYEKPSTKLTFYKAFFSSQ
nr:hypothetical protein [Tanacetum cinerariifolium]